MVHELDLVAAEAALGVALPQDYRDLLKSSDGMTESMASAYLDLWSLEEVIRVSAGDAYGQAESVPGLLLIGSDGGGELLGLDFRLPPPQVVLINAVSASWSEAAVQAESVSRLITLLRDGGSYSFESAG